MEFISLIKIIFSFFLYTVKKPKFIINMDETELNALFTWINALSHYQYTRPYQLFNSKNSFYSLINSHLKIFSSNYNWDAIKQQSEFSNLKIFYNNLKHYHRQNFKIILKQEINIAEIIFASDNKEILKLLKLILGVCVLSDKKQIFVSIILSLDAFYQQTIMKIIQMNHWLEPQYFEISSDNKTTAQLLYKIDFLDETNDRIAKLLIQQRKKCTELECINVQLREQIKKSKQEVVAILNQKCEKCKNCDQQKQQYLINPSLNLEVIDQLKQQLYEQESKYQHEIEELKETIEFLKLSISKKSFILPSNDSLPQPLPQHPPCIPISKHQQSLNAHNQKIKQLIKIEYTQGLELIKKNQTIHNLSKQIKILQQQFKKKQLDVQETTYSDIKNHIIAQMTTGLRQKLLSLRKSQKL